MIRSLNGVWSNSSPRSEGAHVSHGPRGRLPVPRQPQCPEAPFGIAVQRFGPVPALSHSSWARLLGYQHDLRHAVLAFLFGSIILEVIPMCIVGIIGQREGLNTALLARWTGSERSVRPSSASRSGSASSDGSASDSHLCGIARRADAWSLARVGVELVFGLIVTAIVALGVQAECSGWRISPCRCSSRPRRLVNSSRSWAVTTFADLSLGTPSWSEDHGGAGTGYRRGRPPTGRHHHGRHGRLQPRREAMSSSRPLWEFAGRVRDRSGQGVAGPRGGVWQHRRDRHLVDRARRLAHRAHRHSEDQRLEPLLVLRHPGELVSTAFNRNLYRVTTTIVLGVVGSVLAAAGILGHFTEFLIILGVAFPPIAVIMVAEYFVVSMAR